MFGSAPQSKLVRSSTSGPRQRASGDVASLGAFGPPIVLATDAVVVRVIDEDGIIAASDGDAVEILVPRVRIARLLQAIANGDALAVVPARIPLSDR